MILYSLIKRNLKIFFRDKTAIFFSLLSVLILIGLYVLFLGDLMAQNYPGTPGVRFLMDSWIMAGLLGVSTVTTTMGPMGLIVQDKTSGIMKDFKSSPIKRSTIMLAYIISAIVIGFILTIISFILAQTYIIIYGGSVLSFTNVIKILGIIIISLLSSSSMVFFLVSFFKSNNAFATACTVIGTMIGFLAGVYIPIGVLPSQVQGIVKIFPPFHATVLFRQVMMDKPIDISFSNQAIEFIDSFKNEMGVTISISSFKVTPIFSIIYLIIITIIFFLLGWYNLLKKDK